MDLNIKKMYSYQLEKEKDEKYDNYINYLDLFFKKEHKKEKYTKEIIEGKYILTDKNNPKKIIKITPTEFVNIHSLYIELKNYTDTILFKISNLIENKNNINENDRIEFDNLKKKYISFKEQIKDIEIIDKEHYDELTILLNKKIEASNNMAKYYQKRNIEYSNINIMITEVIKNKLIKIFKDNNKKIPTIEKINKIAKENNTPSNEIEKWFSWIELSYLYLLVKKEINDIDNEIKYKELNFELNTKYMIIKKPIIE